MKRRDAPPYKIQEKCKNTEIRQWRTKDEANRRHAHHAKTQKSSTASRPKHWNGMCNGWKNENEKKQIPNSTRSIQASRRTMIAATGSLPFDLSMGSEFEVRNHKSHAIYFLLRACFNLGSSPEWACIMYEPLHRSLLLSCYLLSPVCFLL